MKKNAEGFINSKYLIFKNTKTWQQSLENGLKTNYKMDVNILVRLIFLVLICLALICLALILGSAILGVLISIVPIFVIQILGEQLLLIVLFLSAIFSNSESIANSDIQRTKHVYEFNKNGGRKCFAIDHGDHLMIACGCFWGTLGEFEVACKSEYPDDPIAAYSPQIEYLRAIERILK